MHTVELDTKEATNKWWALQDRRMRNIANASLYSDRQKIRAERMKLALELLYTGKIYDICFGKRSISVKLQAGGSIRDRREFNLLEADWSAEGIYKKATEQGIQYHIPRA